VAEEEEAAGVEQAVVEVAEGAGVVEQAVVEVVVAAVEAEA
jgi:hypothetical protein